MEDKIAKFRAWARKKYPFLREQDIQDLVSFAQLNWLEGKRLNSKYEYIAIDFLRIQGKRMGLKRGSRDAMRNVDIKYLDYMANEKGEEYNGWDTHSVSSKEPLPEVLPDLYLEGLKNIERAVIILYFAWGLSLDEIGHIFNFSESRGSQIMSEAKKKIQRRLKRGGALEDS